MRIKLQPKTAMLLRQFVECNYIQIKLMDEYNPTFDQIKEEHESGFPRVFAGGAHYSDTVFTDQLSIYHYRVWHDSIHIQYGLALGGEPELEVARLQQEEALLMGVNPWDAFLLRVDLEAHIKYHAATGKHPEKQIGLITDYIQQGDSLFKRGELNYA